jgi:hypothetical protein
MQVPVIEQVIDRSLNRIAFTGEGAGARRNDAPIRSFAKASPAVPAPSVSQKRLAVKEWLRANSSQGGGKLDVAERWDCADKDQIAVADALIKE